MIVAFDKGKTFRHDKYDFYKDGRSETPDELKMQFPKAKEMEKNNNTLIKILSENTGQSIEKLKKDMDRDCWLDAEESVKYGLCDEIITKIEL